MSVSVRECAVFEIQRCYIHLYTHLCVGVFVCIHTETPYQKVAFEAISRAER